ncbi:MAG: SAM-dependent methyltransferase [Polyangiaceae bacterium]|nr:SAM-dependent methyltransferase [Polyangiaceae bacterium]
MIESDEPVFDRPDTGRMVDYWLGGDHHHEVDRRAADRIAAIEPSAPAWARVQRGFLQRAVAYLAGEAGIDRFVVAGAGLPTCGNVHEAAPGARVLYTDVSPTTIEHGRRLLEHTPRARYVQADAARLPDLSRELLDELFGPSAPMGIVFIGIAYFFPDEPLRRIFAALHEWAAPGSHLAVSFVGSDARIHAAGLEVYARMGNPIYPRTPEEQAAVLHPWQLVAGGIRPADRWGRDDGEEAGPVFIHGCVARKDVG